MKGRALVLVAGALGAALLVINFWVHPPLREGVLLSLDQLTRPDGHKILGLLRSLATLAALNLAAGALGHAAVRRLSPPPGLEAAATLSVGFVILGLAVLVTGACHHLTAPVLVALVALPAVAAIPWLLRLPRPRPSRWWWLVAAALLPAFLDAFVPELGWDALTYHLALPERFLREQRISIDPFSTYSAFPQGMEMLYTLALGLDGPALAKLLHFEYGLLSLLSLAALAGTVSPRCALLAVVLLLPDPVLQWELRSAYTDLPVTLYLLIAFASLLEWRRTGRRGPLVLAGLLGGACVGVRLPALAVPLTLGLLALLALGGTWPVRARAALTLGAVALAAFVPWMIRNAALTGNPFTPLLQSLFYRPGREFFDPLVLDQQVRFAQSVGMGRGPLQLLALPWNLTMRSRAGVYAGSFGHEVAVLPVFGALATLLLPAVRRHPTVRAALITSGIFSALWFLGAQEARYLLPVFPLLALAAAATLDHAIGDDRAGRWLLVLPAAALLHGLIPWMNRVGYEYGYALGTLPRERMELADPSARVAATLRRTLPADARLLMLFEARSYLFRGIPHIPYHAYEGSPVLQIIHRTPDPAALRCRLAELGVTHLLVNTGHIERHPTFTAAYSREDYAADLRRLRAFLQGWTSPLLSDAGVLAVALRPPPPCPPST
jgi:hypothetical protein